MTGEYLIDLRYDRINLRFYSRPTRRHQNSDSNILSYQILLMSKLLICGD